MRHHRYIVLIRRKFRRHRRERQAANTASLTVLLVSKDERDVSTTQVMQELHEKTRDIPGAEITVSGDDDEPRRQPDPDQRERA